jgi:hypothetical protein
MAKNSRLGLRRLPITNEPDIADVYKAAVVSALRWAWKQVIARWPKIIATGREEQITECMCRVLNEQGADDQRLAPGLDSFETVNRGAKVKSADGRVEKAPDLVLRPIGASGVRNRSDWGVFIECKIIAPENSHSPNSYCKNGVARFVSAEYAPQMPSATMLAYVRDARLPHAALAPYLDSTYATKSHKSAAVADMSISLHSRRALRAPCVDIVLTHIWLDTGTG